MARKTVMLLVAVLGVVTLSTARPDSLMFNRNYCGVSGGLGVSLINVGDVVDFVSNGTNQSHFAAAAEFFGALEVQIADNWGIKGEYSYLLNSYNIPQGGIILPYSYHVQMPSALLEYVLKGNGYFFKFGGGGGYHFAQFEQDYPATITYTAKGIGLKIEGEGNTAFDEHLYGYIGADARDDILGDLKDDAGNILVNKSLNKNVKMNFITVGLKFGLTYFF